MVTKIVADAVEFMDRKSKDDGRVIERDKPHGRRLAYMDEEKQ